MLRDEGGGTQLPMNHRDKRPPAVYETASRL